jgi:hypothetical protein
MFSYLTDAWLEHAPSENLDDDDDGIQADIHVRHSGCGMCEIVPHTTADTSHANV